MIRNIIVFALTFCVMLTGGYLDIAAGETVGCGGQVATSIINGNDVDFHTTYTLKNFSDTQTIVIDRIVVYDADGKVRCDYPNTDSFPPPFKSLLYPHQATAIYTQDMKFCSKSIIPGHIVSRGGIQTIINWSFSSGKTGEPLSVFATGMYVDNTGGYTFGWSPVVCSPVKLK